jgi:hypothetical protein
LAVAASPIAAAGSSAAVPYIRALRLIVDMRILQVLWGWYLRSGATEC